MEQEEGTDNAKARPADPGDNGDTRCATRALRDQASLQPVWSRGRKDLPELTTST